LDTIDLYPLPFLIGTGFLVLLLVMQWRRKRRKAYLFYFSAFWFYLMSVADATVFPIMLPSTRQPASHILSGVNLVPLDFGGLFQTSTRIILFNLLGNILLTIPLGFGVNLINRLSSRNVPFLAVGVGLAIEGAQLLVSLAIGSRYRGVDINDVLLNAAGVVIGYGLFRVFAGLYRAASDRFGIPSR
jgi:glycopeptide antibiotics resistance protein